MEGEKKRWQFKRKYQEKHIVKTEENAKRDINCKNILPS